MFGRFRRSKNELEQQLKEALSKENWMAPNSLLQEIALTTEEAEDRALILRHVWAILESGASYWRRTLKALALIEVLLKRGTVKMIQEIQKDSWKIARYREHRVKEQGREVGEGIREKAKTIGDMLENPEELNRERNKNYELYSKMSGVGNAEPEQKKKSFGQNISKAVGGKRAQKEALQNEIDQQQKMASQHIKIQEFVAETGASEQAASRFLHLSHGNMKRAVDEYHRAQANARPSPGQLREMCQQVMTITMVPESRAMNLLEQCRFDVGDAIDKALSGGGNSLQERSTTASSDSDSDTDSESDDDNRRGQRANMQGRSSSPGFGAMPRDTGAFGATPWTPRANGSFGQQDGRWSPRANGSFGQQDGGVSPRATGPFGQYDQYASGTGQGSWPMQSGNPFGGKGMQAGNPFGGKGYGKGGPNESFNAQPGGFPGFKGAGFPQQMAGGKGGFSGNPFGGSKNSSFGQQAGFGGYDNAFAGQKGGFNGQMAGFNAPQQQQWMGFSQGGQGASFGGKGGTNNPFGNF
mmetsp:Transcript_129338/g.241949  ORF Transcript_129338/g.241949 Transcript_129338/m.241949 type:complete len:526 (+) Transcript_129338:75-1652(+)